MKFLKRFFPIELFVLLATLTGWYFLTTPDNPFTRHFRRDFEGLDQRVIVGPFPTKADFPILIENHVEVIVSLLNPDIPYESKLIKEEEAEARASGLRWVNFPMSSIFGQRFGDAYEKNAGKAAQFIMDEKGKVYLHCYLGKHRVESVRNILKGKGISFGLYPREVQNLNTYVDNLDHANSLYEEKKYSETLEALSLIPQRELGSDARLMAGWAQYHLNQFDDARGLFESVLESEPKNLNGLLGSGLVLLKIGQLELAQVRLTEAEQLDQRNAEVYEALGLLSIRQGQIKKAKEFLMKSLSIDPNNREATDALKKIKAESGDKI